MGRVRLLPDRRADACAGGDCPELERVLAEADENPVMAANLNGFLAVQEAMGGRIDDARHGWRPG